MVDRHLDELLRGIGTRPGAKAFLNRALSLVIKHHGEDAARQMMAEVATRPNKAKMRNAFILSLYDDIGTANGTARYLRDIGFCPTLEAADKAIDYARKRRPKRGRKK